MVLLTFNSKKKQLLDGSKETTIRKNVDYWWSMSQRYLERSQPLIFDMWWLNPRNQHPDCYKMGQSHNVSMVVKPGSAFSDYDAELDGFNSLNHLIQRLAFINKMTFDEVLNSDWIILRFDWLNGYPKKGGTS